MAIALAPARPGSAAESLVCAVSTATPGGHLVARFDFDSMTGAVEIDAAARTRRIRVSAVPHSATYLLVFQGYAPGDRKPKGERLKAGKTIVARVVAYGERNHLFFDAGFHPGIAVPSDGFECQ